MSWPMLEPVAPRPPADVTEIEVPDEEQPDPEHQPFTPETDPDERELN